MQFSKRVAEYSRMYGIDPKDVLFAMLTAAGASVPESFAIIYRPACSTQNALAARASNHISQRPGLRKLMEELNTQQADNTDQPNTRRRGRPRKQDTDQAPAELLDYTDKDAVLKEYASIVVTAEKIGDKLSALNGIATLQRMKQEAAVQDEKRVQFYIPLSYQRAEELRTLLQRYYSDKAENPD